MKAKNTSGQEDCRITISDVIKDNPSLLNEGYFDEMEIQITLYSKSMNGRFLNIMDDVIMPAIIDSINQSKEKVEEIKETPIIPSTDTSPFCV